MVFWKTALLYEGNSDYFFSFWWRGVNNWEHLPWFGTGETSHLLACRGSGGLYFQHCLHSAARPWAGRGWDLRKPDPSWHFHTWQADFLSGFSLESQCILHGKNANFCFSYERQGSSPLGRSEALIQALVMAIVIHIQFYIPKLSSFLGSCVHPIRLTRCPSIWPSFVFFPHIIVINSFWQHWHAVGWGRHLL